VGGQGKGGRDWQAVAALLEGREAGKMRDLFLRADRLAQLVGRANEGMDEGVPRLLHGLTDALVVWHTGEGCFDRPPVPPTFTFPVVPTAIGGEGETPLPRPYAVKRTPSWTDRVMWRVEGAELLRVEALEGITISDHVPLVAMLVIPVPAL
jgi:hypothetical protein